MLHTVTKRNPWLWNDVATIPGARIASQWPRPETVDPDAYCQVISYTWFRSGLDMADAIAAGLAPGDRALVMIDELRGDPDSIATITECAGRMRAAYPQYAGRWGAYLVNGTNISYPNLQPAVDALLRGNAVLAPEFYYYADAYIETQLRSGVLAADRDFAAFVRGGGRYPKGRWVWLMERRKHLVSSSLVVPVFGVTDRFASSPHPDFRGAAVFLDRLFYVWCKPVQKGGVGWRSWARSYGIGSWKWDTIDHGGVSSTSRDRAFAESSSWYLTEGKSGSRLGQVLR